MVHTKHQKSKPKKPAPHGKKYGKHADISEFRDQLDLLGLKVIQVTSDGNCFFRALADQLEGNEEEHEKYRRMVVQYIVKNREMFEPFIEDDVPFEEYCQSMEKDGTWAGHMELQAASLVTHSNICIHRHMSPRWYIRNFDNQGEHMIHLSYHDGEHYNSVRSKEDPCDGPAEPIIIKADVTLTASSQHAKAAGAHSKSRTSNNVNYAGAVKMVMAGSGCEDSAKVEQILSEVDGDIDAAIEFLIAERGVGETIDGSDIVCEKDSNGYDEKKIFDKHDVNSADEKALSSNEKRVGNGKLSSMVDKKIPRNKVCPCGSKKKYKSCCGTASGKTNSKIVVEQEVDSSRGKKGKKEGKKVAPASKASIFGSDQALPDMGALCI